MKRWFFFDTNTGLFNGSHFATNEHECLINNIPAGLRELEGIFDPLSQRVDLDVLKQIDKLDAEKDAALIEGLKAKLVVDYQPPQPDEDHEWNADAKRWQIKPDIAKKRQVIAAAQAEIDRMEQSQLRALRELLLDPDNANAKERLQSIDEQINIQRLLIQRNG